MSDVSGYNLMEGEGGEGELQVVVTSEFRSFFFDYFLSFFAQVETTANRPIVINKSEMYEEFYNVHNVSAVSISFNGCSWMMYVG